LHDNRGGQSQADDLHLPIGVGTVDFAAILASLVRAGYDGTMTLEVEPELQGIDQIHVEILVKEFQKILRVCLWTRLLCLPLYFLKPKKAKIQSIFIYQPDTDFREDPIFPHLFNE
jgi:hypothetical protein